MVVGWVCAAVFFCLQDMALAWRTGFGGLGGAWDLGMELCFESCLQHMALAWRTGFCGVGFGGVGFGGSGGALGVLSFCECCFCRTCGCFAGSLFGS